MVTEVVARRPMGARGEGRKGGGADLVLGGGRSLPGVREGEHR